MWEDGFYVPKDIIIRKYMRKNKEFRINVKFDTKLKFREFILDMENFTNEFDEYMVRHEYVNDVIDGFYLRRPRRLFLYDLIKRQSELEKYGLTNQTIIIEFENFISNRKVITSNSSSNHYYNDIPYTMWPFYLSFSLLLLLFSFILFINKFEYGLLMLQNAIIMVTYFTYLWFKDMVIESTYLGKYNRKLRATLVAGFMIFLSNEVMLFGGFFWAYFDRIFHPSAFTGSNSMPLGMERFLWYKKPLYATLLLLFSSIVFNRANFCMKWGSWSFALFYSSFGIILGYIFLFIQIGEYMHLSFSISDSVYASCFYLLTGFHGFHVTIGLIFLNIQHERLANWHFTKERHLGYSMAMIYWHFVDIVWIFLFIFVYCFNDVNINIEIV